MNSISRKFVLVGILALAGALTASNLKGDCPAAVDWNPQKHLDCVSKSGTAVLCGFDEYTNPSSPPKRYRIQTPSGALTANNHCDNSGTDVRFTESGTYTYDKNTCAESNNQIETFLDLNSGSTFSGTRPKDWGPGNISGTAVTITATRKFFSAIGCAQSSFWSGTAQCDLSDPDSEEDAMKRVSPLLGSSHTAFKVKRTAGFNVEFCNVHFVAGFDIVCPGDYEFKVHYSTKAHGASGDGAPAEPYLITRPMESGYRTIEDDLRVPTADTDYILNYVEFRAVQKCTLDSPGRSQNRTGSIKVGLSMGSGVASVQSGEVRLDTDTIAPATYTPAALMATLAEDVGEIIHDGSGALRQCKTPQTLADVVTLNSSSYEVRFYGLGDVGAQEPTTKIYSVSGSPFVVHKFENPDAALSLTNRLRITETRGSNVRVSVYAYDSGTSTWTLSTGNGLRQETEVVTNYYTDSTRVTTVRDASNNVVSKNSKSTRGYPWGTEVLQEILDPDGAALTTTYEYYDNSSTDGGAYAHLRKQTNPDSSWETHTYDSSGRPLKTVRPFLNAASTDADNLCRVTNYTYGTLSDLDGDGVDEQLTTIVDSTLGQETSRSYKVDWSKLVTLGTDACTRRSDIRCVVAGAIWNASGNLVTETLSYTVNPFSGRSRRVTNPDGTVVITTYLIDSGGQTTTTIKSGAINGASDDIIAGTITVTNTNAFGQITSETVTDVVSGLTVGAWAATAFDSVGRPTRLDYPDGTYETRDYACCGLSSSRDREGNLTTFTYNDLGRQTDVVRNGITMHTDYDADGRPKMLTRIGSDMTAMIQETNFYDFAGRLTEHRDALSRSTAYSTALNGSTGETTRTKTNPDSGTRIDVTSRDGSLQIVSGTAVAPLSYEYGVDSTGLFTKETKIGTSGTTTEWTKSYVDFAGRPFEVLYADSAVALSYFNAIGQLVRSVDPDGVVTLYAYNNRGQQEVSAIDLNGNNAIDYAASDRITKTTSDVSAKTDGASTYTVLRTTTQVWETPSSDTPVAVSISEQTSDGLHSWQTVRGLTTSSATVTDGSGGRTVTTTRPDGVKSIQVFSGDRLNSTTIKTVADVQLSAATYTYDFHGRMQTATDARTGATIYSYYDDDQIHAITTPDPDPARTGDGYDPQTTTYTYDSAGRVSILTQPDSGVVNTTYYPTGALKRAWGTRTYPVEYSYDTQGRVKTLTTWQDFAGNSGVAVTTWNYNAQRGWLNAKLYNDGNGPNYTYFASGRLHTRTWARGVRTTYAYGASGDLSGITYTDATAPVSVTYDRSGRPNSTTDSSGTRTLSYAVSSQLQNEIYSAGPLNGLSVQRTFDSLARLSGTSTLSSSTSLVGIGYTYDAASRLDTVTQGSFTAMYGYLANSSLVQSVVFKQASNTRLTTIKSYDDLNRIISVTNTPSSSSPFSVAYQYNAANQRVKAKGEDNAYWSYSYDRLGQVSSAKKYGASASMLPGYDSAWTFDDIGNRKTTVVNGQTSNYIASLLNEYSSRTVPGNIDIVGAASAASTVTVSLNSGVAQSTVRTGELFFKQLTVDNSSTALNESLQITGVQNLAGPSGEDAVSEANKTSFVPQTPETYTYDADGNLISDARWTYYWDAENRIVSIETRASAYNAGSSRVKFDFSFDDEGRRWGKNISIWSGTGWALTNSIAFIYDGRNLQAEFDRLSGLEITNSYAWGLDLGGSPQSGGGVGGLVFMFNASTSANAPGFDGNGNIVGLVDLATGAKSGSYDYNAFGETIQIDGAAATANHFRFSTKYSEDETGLYDYGYRFYRPSTAKWLSRDPLEEHGGYNVLGFVSNSPTNSTDAVGLFEGAPNVTNPFIKPITPPPPEIGIAGANVVTALGVAAVVTGTAIYDGYIEPAIDEAYDDRDIIRKRPRQLSLPGGFKKGDLTETPAEDDNCRRRRHRGLLQAQGGPQGSQTYNESVLWDKRTPLTITQGRGALALLVNKMNFAERGVFFGAIIKASMWMSEQAAYGGTGPTSKSFYVRDHPGSRKTVYPGSARIDVNVYEGLAFTP